MLKKFKINNVSPNAGRINNGYNINVKDLLALNGRHNPNVVDP